MCKYTYRKVIIKNKTTQKERLLIDFCEDKYTILSTFLESEVMCFEEWIKENFDIVLDGTHEYRQIAGNVCEIEITAETTKVYDMLAEDGMGNWCEVDTKELRQIIEEWCNEVRAFKQKHNN